MNIIVAVDQHWGIGCEGQLLFSIPEDMKYFKNKTSHQVVVMGHATFRSLPNQEPLKDRVNIVFSRDENLKIEGVLVCHSLEDLKGLLEDYPSQEVWVIGGEGIYNLLLDHCRYAYITKIGAILPADKRFPDLSKIPQWQLTEESSQGNHGDLTYRFTRYQNIHVQPL